MDLSFDEEEYPLQKETYKIICVSIQVHRILGKGFSEIVYKDAMEHEFNTRIFLKEKKSFLCGIKK